MGEFPEIYSLVYNGLDLIGVLTASILGGLVARERGYDVVGFLIVCIVSALGGGMMRDVLIAQGSRLQAPPVALTNSWYFGLAVLGAFVAYLLPLEDTWVQKVMVFLDALVIGCWSVTGAIKTLNAGFAYGFNFLAPTLMGLVTAVGGGIMRDILVSRRPVVFGGNTLYATGSVVSTLPAIALWYGNRPVTAMIVGTLLGGAVVLLAARYKWVLPVNDDYSVVDTISNLSSSFARHLEAKREEKKHDEQLAEERKEFKRKQHRRARSLRKRSTQIRRRQSDHDGEQADRPAHPKPDRA